MAPAPVGDPDFVEVKVEANAANSDQNPTTGVADSVVASTPDAMPASTFTIGKEGRQGWWGVAKSQLGPGASDAQILARAQQLISENPGVTVLHTGDVVNAATGDITDAARQTYTEMNSAYQANRLAVEMERAQSMNGGLEFDSSPGLGDRFLSGGSEPMAGPWNIANPYAPGDTSRGPRTYSEGERYTLLGLGGLAGSVELLFDSFIKAPVIGLGTVVGSGLHRILPGAAGDYFEMHTENLGEFMHNTKDWVTSDHPLDPIFANVDQRLATIDATSSTDPFNAGRVGGSLGGEAALATTGIASLSRTTVSLTRNGMAALRSGETAAASLAEFRPLGVAGAEAEAFLQTTTGRQMLAELRAGDPGASVETILNRANTLISSGSDLPTAMSSPSRLLKMIPEGPATPSAYTPFFTTQAELDRVLASGRNLSDAFGLPSASHARAFSVFEITPKQPATVFKSRIAPTSEYPGTIATHGGAEQVLVLNRKLFTDPVYVRRIPGG